MNEMQNNIITLYPSNWLYNAGVVGLLKYIDSENFLTEWNDEEKYSLDSSGELKLNRKLFTKIDIERKYFSDEKEVSLVGNNPYYRNFIDTKGIQKEAFKSLVNQLSISQNIKNRTCYLCTRPYFIEDTSSILSQKGGDLFLEKVESFDFVHNTLLGPSQKFPNAYWNLENKFPLCHMCIFILIHHHLALTTLSDGSKIFINAPSFKLMYELNRLVKAMFEAENKEFTRKEILAISLIEYSRKLSVSLGMWMLMNIEVVVQSKDNVDFFNLPYDVMRIISDRKIAGLLSDIGETQVFKLILDQKYSELVDLIYKILRTSLKKQYDITKYDRDTIRDLIRMDKNKSNPTEFANKLLILYSLIEEKLKGVEV